MVIASALLAAAISFVEPVTTNHNRVAGATVTITNQLEVVGGITNAILALEGEIAAAGKVKSVNGMTGDVVLSEADPSFTSWKAANSTAAGQSAKAGTLGVAIGSSANSQGGLSAVAIGVQAKAKANYSVAVGYGADAKAVMSVAIGEGATATNFASVAIGAGTDEINPEIVRSHGNGTFNIGAKSLDKVWLGETNLEVLVKQASPPVELPAKWALSNVTNANGQAVGAGDVGALPTTGGTMTGDLSIKDNTAIILKTYEGDEDSMIHLVDSMYGMEFLSLDSFYFNSRLPYGWMYLNGQRVATESWQSLSRGLMDANTNRTADVTCLGTNICKIIQQPVSNLVVECRDIYHDDELDVTFKKVVSGGRVYMKVIAVDGENAE